MLRAIGLVVLSFACGAGVRSRAIHPTTGSSECIEMYGSCTEPPDQLCTSNALVLQCGERGELPATGEQLTCVCP